MSQERRRVPPAASTDLGNLGGFRTHRHPAHQLTWVPRGSLAIGAAGATWVLARETALWIPAGIEHDVLATGDTSMRSLYFSPRSCRVRWTTPTAVVSSGLVGQLLDHLLDAPDGSARRRAELVIFDLLEPVPAATLRVPLPTDERARQVADALHADPGDGRTLAEWGSAIGASGRTLARLIERETGMGFEQWRTRLRIAHATRLLAVGNAVGRVGLDVGYSTPSAFVAAFRRVVGVSPGVYAASRRESKASSPRIASTPRVVPAGLVVEVDHDLTEHA